ncbi:guanine deaminase [Candidatus Methylocalor cossyra]|uniref:Guanine deaminase n=1 Tax=Candidatus Methylocalor cossyra TaxID=3108543 RepID=A0ABP1C7M8_9GAMM
MATLTLHCGTLAHLRRDPFLFEDALEIIPAGALAVDPAGRIAAVDRCAPLRSRFPDAALVDHGEDWLVPGLVDGHLHFPQFYATAAPGDGLLDWLERSVFPAEAEFRDPGYAASAAERFVARLLAAGTTTALVFGASHYPATEALFQAARRAGLRLIAGLTLMDQNAPPSLLNDLDQARRGMERLIALCTGEPRLRYAVTPRYPLSCSRALLELCGAVLATRPECYLQTHINETQGEIEAVRGAFPGFRHYLEVYDRFGLLGPRTVLAHSIHSSDAELDRMAATGCAVVHCPTSNLYLGSGLFPLRRHLERGVGVAIGTDIGAGTQFSLWRELAEAFKVQALQALRLSVAQLLYLGTLGGARALRLDGEIGNFAPGKSADFVILSAGQEGYLAERLRRCESLEQQLFCLLHLAGEAQVRATYSAGRPAPWCDPAGL